MYIIVDYSNLTDVKILRGEDNRTMGFKEIEDAYNYVSNIGHGDWEIIKI